MMKLTLLGIIMKWLVIVLIVTESTHVEITRDVYYVFCAPSLVITTQFKVLEK